MKLHFKIFDQERIQVFKKLKFFSQEGFLAGGTALALEIGHRLSYDFDLFCHAKINESLILKAKKVPASWEPGLPINKVPFRYRGGNLVKTADNPKVYWGSRSG